jgi:Family of unknown function (DUF5946)
MVSMKTKRECPGCGLTMPLSEKVTYDGYFNSSPECWVVFEEVLAVASSNTAYGPVYQLIIDAYAAQHPGGKHPDRSVLVHLAGLYAAFELKVPFSEIPPLLQRLAAQNTKWPHLEPPDPPSPLNVLELALAEGSADFLTRAGTWASSVWNSWAEQHERVSRFVNNAGT